jgi:hypothetical protein
MSSILHKVRSNALLKIISMLTFDLYFPSLCVVLPSSHLHSTASLAMYLSTKFIVCTVLITMSFRVVVGFQSI